MKRRRQQPAYEQLSIFSFLNVMQDETKEESKFSWDDDINDIHAKIVKLVEKYGMRLGKQEWSIWNHVPNFGYRMDITVYLNKGQYTEDFNREIQDVVDFAANRNIELSPFAPIFIGNETEGWMPIYSMFLDKKRQKIK